eukprot:5509794-Pleurochrysis_carterae.AAC.1
MKRMQSCQSPTLSTLTSRSAAPSGGDSAPHSRRCADSGQRAEPRATPATTSAATACASRSPAQRRAT